MYVELDGHETPAPIAPQAEQRIVRPVRPPSTNASTPSPAGATQELRAEDVLEAIEDNPALVAPRAEPKSSPDIRAAFPSQPADVELPPPPPPGQGFVLQWNVAHRILEQRYSGAPEAQSEPPAARTLEIPIIVDEMPQEPSVIVAADEPPAMVPLPVQRHPFASAMGLPPPPFAVPVAPAVPLPAAPPSPQLPPPPIAQASMRPSFAPIELDIPRPAPLAESTMELLRREAFLHRRKLGWVVAIAVVACGGILAAGLLRLALRSDPQAAAATTKRAAAARIEMPVTADPPVAPAATAGGVHELPIVDINNLPRASKDAAATGVGKTKKPRYPSNGGR